MKKEKILVAALLGSGALLGCAGVGVMSTSDPKQKLSDARHLAYIQDRPLIAERLIKEALEKCQLAHDKVCEAESLHTYAAFFLSDAVTRHETFYREHGFLDETASFDRRNEAAVRYFTRAAPLLRESRKFDWLTNAYVNIGDQRMRLGDRDQACIAYVESGKAHVQNLEENPGVKVVVQDGFKDYKKYLAARMKAAGCP